MELIRIEGGMRLYMGVLVSMLFKRNFCLNFRRLYGILFKKY